MSILSTQSALTDFVGAFCSDVAMYDRSPWDVPIPRRKLRRMSKRRLKKFVKQSITPFGSVFPFHQSNQES